MEDDAAPGEAPPEAAGPEHVGGPGDARQDREGDEGDREEGGQDQDLQRAPPPWIRERGPPRRRDAGLHGRATVEARDKDFDGTTVRRPSLPFSSRARGRSGSARSGTGPPRPSRGTSPCPRS